VYRVKQKPSIFCSILAQKSDLNKKVWKKFILINLVLNGNLPRCNLIILSYGF
jgi:hypothetical protein